MPLNVSDLPGSFDSEHMRFMEQAFLEAEKAFERNEVPVGAVIVQGSRIIARGHNQVEMLSDPTAHAEMIALTAAFEYTNEKYLNDCRMYVTLEPCPMCAGALVWAKLGELYIAAQDEKSGACGSLFNIASNTQLNHRIPTHYGLLEKDSEDLLKRFFASKRA
ncbi:nucleoside deaminase [Balneolaceae bacterium ANBcel3]|nr:nucleoside deaminase [Balneolaceae bacterium ANBcel3]